MNVSVSMANLESIYLIVMKYETSLLPEFKYDKQNCPTFTDPQSVNFLFLFSSFIVKRINIGIRYFTKLIISENKMLVWKKGSELGIFCYLECQWIYSHFIEV